MLDEDGRKLSKRLRNYPDPDEVFETIGSDALRWFLMSSPILRGGDLRIDREGTGIGEVGAPGAQPDLERVPLLHALRERRRLPGDAAAPTRPQLLDRYILAKTRELVETVHRAPGRLRHRRGLRRTSPAFLDALNNWYIRRSRDRFWAPDRRGPRPADKRDAYDTLYTVLHACPGGRAAAAAARARRSTRA